MNPRDATARLHCQPRWSAVGQGVCTTAERPWGQGVAVERYHLGTFTDGVDGAAGALGQKRACGVVAAQCASQAPIQRAKGCKGSGWRNTNLPPARFSRTALGGAKENGSLNTRSVDMPDRLKFSEFLCRAAGNRPVWLNNQAIQLMPQRMSDQTPRKNPASGNSLAGFFGTLAWQPARRTRSRLGGGLGVCFFAGRRADKLRLAQQAA